jgi:rubrerythrin
LLSQKELHALQAAVTAESLLNEKFGFYSANCSDPGLKDLFSRVQQDEQRHLNSLVQFLNQQSTNVQ